MVDHLALTLLSSEGRHGLSFYRPSASSISVVSVHHQMDGVETLQRKGGAGIRRGASECCVRSEERGGHQSS